MTTTDIIILNFEEIRRRSIKLWSAIPHENIHWKPDVGAFSIIEMVRHVLEGEHLYHKIIENGALDDYLSPWKTRRYEGIDEEIEFAKPYREAFLSYIKNIAASDLKNVWVERK